MILVVIHNILAFVFCCRSGKPHCRELVVKRSLMYFLKEGMILIIVGSLHVWLILCRHVAHFSESYIRSVASKSTANFRQSVGTQTQKFTDFEVGNTSTFDDSLFSICVVVCMSSLDRSSYPSLSATRSGRVSRMPS